MTPKNLLRLMMVALALFAFATSPSAQAPNTATIVVDVVDQTGAVV
jgi:hypothetical protein